MGRAEQTRAPLAKLRLSSCVEGYARELVSKVQQWRKDLGLELTDRIELGVRVEPAVMQALRRFEDMIRTTVLADSLTEGALEGAESKAVDLNGKQAAVTLRKVSK